MKLTSSAFAQNQPIPVRYTCDGVNHHPPLAFSQVPERVASFALVVEDPDAPARVFTHWLLYDIPPATREIPEQQVPPGSREGINDFGTRGYGGPCPPSGTHRYFFKLFALDTRLALPAGAAKEEILAKMQNHVLATAELMGIYSRKR